MEKRIIREEVLEESSRECTAEEVKTLPQAVINLPDGKVIKASSVLLIVTNNVDFDGETKEDGAMGVVVAGPWSSAELMLAGSILTKRLKQMVVTEFLQQDIDS